MKRFIMIFSALLVVGAIAAVAAAAFGKFSAEGKLPSISKNATIAQAADFYADAVDLTKNEKDMDIKVVTAITFTEFNCPSENLKDLILYYLGYQVGARETRTTTYSINSGKDITGKTPFDIIQPAGTNIEKGIYNGLTLNSVEKDDKHTVVSFSIDKESADYFQIAEAYMSDNADFSVFAPRHFNYIDIDGIVYYLKEMLDFNFSSDDVEYAVAEIEAAEITLGRSEINADINDNALLTEITVNVPVAFDSTVKVLNSNMNIAARLVVTQQYTFTYNNEN